MCVCVCVCVCEKEDKASVVNDIKVCERVFVYLSLSVSLSLSLSLSLCMHIKVYLCIHICNTYISRYVIYMYASMCDMCIYLCT